MRNVLIVDTETNGLDPKTDAAIEVAAILYSIEHASMVSCFGSLIQNDRNEAEAINEIPVSLLPGAAARESAWGRVQDMAEHADAIVAHNAEFDRSFAPSWLVDFRPWICTLEDVTWPEAKKPNQTLVALALDHGLGVAHVHRAISDCLLIERLLTRCAEMGHDLDAMLSRGLRPKVLLQAVVSYDDREKAKAAGFRWDPNSKRWLRRMVQEDAAFDFKTAVVLDAA